MQDEHYKNGYHDGYAEALFALKTMLKAKYEVSDDIGIEDVNFLIDKMLK